MGNERTGYDILREMDLSYPTTDVELPSRASIYSNGNVPSVVKIRPITTKEEKILYASNSAKALDDVIKACIVEPASLSLGNLIVPDKYAILLNLRIISIGDVYKVRYKCPSCGEVNEYEINLSELPINYLEESFEEPYTLALETLDKTVGIRLLRGKDLDEVDDMVKRIRRKANGPIKGDPGYIFRLAKYIQEIDGIQVSFDIATKFVESWSSKTSIEFRDLLEDIKVGHDIELFKDCDFCGEELDFDLPFTGEFFRPSRK
jgi:hypothetical protein